MKRRFRLAALAATVLVSACATSAFKAPLGGSTKLESTKAYLYGSFAMNGVSEIHARTNNYSSIGLRFICDDDTEFTVGLAPRDVDQVIEVPAKRCSLRTTMASHGMTGHAIRESRYGGSALQNVQFTAGRMHYAGDVTGRISTESDGRVVMTRWNIVSHLNHYDETSQRMLAERPALAALPRADVSGLPRAALARAGS